MNDIDDLSELFTVVQFFPAGQYEYVCRNVGAKAAVDAAYHYTHSVGAMVGVTRRVIITDAGGILCFEWLAGEGVVFPKQECIGRTIEMKCT